MAHASRRRLKPRRRREASYNLYRVWRMPGASLSRAPSRGIGRRGPRPVVWRSGRSQCALSRPPNFTGMRGHENPGQKPFALRPVKPGGSPGFVRGGGCRSGLRRAHNGAPFPASAPAALLPWPPSPGLSAFRPRPKSKARAAPCFRPRFAGPVFGWRRANLAATSKTAAVVHGPALRGSAGGPVSGGPPLACAVPGCPHLAAKTIPQRGPIGRRGKAMRRLAFLPSWGP